MTKIQGEAMMQDPRLVIWVRRLFPVVAAVTLLALSGCADGGGGGPY